MEFRTLADKKIFLQKITEKKNIIFHVVKSYYFENEMTLSI